MRLVAIDRGHRFRTLLAALALLLTSYPLVESNGLGRVGFYAFFQLVLLAGLVSLRRSTTWFLVGLALVAPPIVKFWGEIAAPGLTLWRSAPLQGIAQILSAAYLLLLVAFILRDLFASREVTTDRLYGALSAYFLIALVFGALYTALQIMAPGSFAIGSDLREAAILGEHEPLRASGTLFYFSFITLTTVGFGDVTPASPIARMLVMWEAIVGQAFLTILVARLVGLHVAGRADAPAQAVPPAPRESVDGADPAP